MAGFAGNCPDLDITVDEFGHFEFEQRANELWMAARYDDLWPLAFASHFKDVALDAVSPLEAFIGNAL